MHITCPHCGFSRDVLDENIPPNTEVANCPKCKQKFRFRNLSLEVDEHMWVGTPRPVGTPKPEQDTAGELSEPADMPESNGEEERPKPIRITEEAESEEDIWDRLESMGGSLDEGSRTLPDEEYLLGLRGRTKKGSAPEGIPFERTHELGFLKGFFLTIKEVLFQPKSFFSRMDPRGGYWRPLFFLYLIHFILLLLQLILVQMDFYPNMSLPNVDMADGAVKTFIQRGHLFVIVLSPLIIPLVLFIGAGVSHLLLLLFRASSKGYRATARVTAYSTVPNLFSIIPLAGQPVAIIWMLTVFVIGLKSVHQSKTWRVILAVVVVPFLVGLIANLLLTYLGHQGLQAMPPA